MYTRRTGNGCQEQTERCTRTATSILRADSSATSPSTPAVMRPYCAACLADAEQRVVLIGIAMVFDWLVLLPRYFNFNTAI